jgi:hypothetical protein
MWVMLSFVLAANGVPALPSDEQSIIAELASVLVVGGEYLPPVDSLTLTDSPVEPLHENATQSEIDLHAARRSYNNYESFCRKRPTEATAKMEARADFCGKLPMQRRIRPIGAQRVVRNGRLHISRVGFSADKQTALLIYEYLCPLCSIGELVTAEKIEGKWRIVSRWKYMAS